MKERVKSYKTTKVHWGKTQSKIMELLNKRGILDVQFTAISQETALQSGLKMEEGTSAIMLLFQKNEELADGIFGKIPVRVILPNIPQDDPQAFNQYYRLLFWYLKSKFEAIDTGLVEFAEEFMPHLQISDKQGRVGRVWDSFKKGFYKAIGEGKQGNVKLLPPVASEQEEK